MKTGTSHSPKLINLCRMLNLKRWQAIGVLNAIWEFACSFAPQGDIGRWTDAEIAASIEWDGNGMDLVAALVETRWIDRDEDHRLLIHDWKDHAPHYIKDRLAKQGVMILSEKAVESLRKPEKSGRDSSIKGGEGRQGKRREERESTESASRFSPPSIEEVKTYCRKVGSHISPEGFVDFYTANGWQIGRNPMRDWQAAVRSWGKRDFGHGKGKCGPAPPNKYRCPKCARVMEWQQGMGQDCPFCAVRLERVVKSEEGETNGK
jgi:hypothetical protein